MQFNDDPESNTPSNLLNTSEFNVNFIASTLSLVFTVSNDSCTDFRVVNLSFIAATMLFRVSCRRCCFNAFISALFNVSSDLMFPGRFPFIFSFNKFT